MKCLVTGATGFIGSHLVEFLLQKGCEVGVVMRPISNPWRIQEHISYLRVMESDLEGIKKVKAQILEFQPQVLLHIGWQGVDKNQRDDVGQIRNMQASLELFDLCLASGCQYILGLGSQAEYGQTNRVLVEDMAAYPDTLYGAAKLLTGMLGQKKCADLGIPFAWLRLTAAFGPKDDLVHLIPYLISTLLQGGTPALTQGRQRWDYLYIDDVLSAVWDLMVKSKTQGIFNLSSGQAVPVRQICETVRDCVDPRLPLEFGKVPYPEDGRMLLEANNHRLRQATGWKPQTSLMDGLEKTVEWYARQIDSKSALTP